VEGRSPWERNMPTIVFRANYVDFASAPSASIARRTPLSDISECLDADRDGILMTSIPFLEFDGRPAQLRRLFRCGRRF
jgi:hypothetical protein